jgi:hypothetical protein
LQERLVAFEFRTWDPFEDEDQTLATERLPAFEFRTWDSYDDEPLTTVSADTMRASLQAVVGCRRRPSQHPKKPQERLKNARAVRASQQEQNRGGHEASLAVTAQPEQPQQQKHHDHPTTSSPTLPASGDVRRPRHVERAAGNVECVAPPPEVLNPGSAGHPEMCAKICLYFLRGNCENGSRCGYCHCPHTSSRKANLDRMSRDFIRDVHHSEAYRLMLPEVLKKLQRQGFDLRGLPILDMPNLRQDARNRVRRRRLAASLAKVSLRDLLTHMARRMPTETPESDSCNAMLDQVNNCCTSLIPGWETGALWEHRDICGGGAPHSRTIA